MVLLKTYGWLVKIIIFFYNILTNLPTGSGPVSEYDYKNNGSK